MSDDPLDPDDWREDDPEEPAADPAEGTEAGADGESDTDGDPFADVASDRAGDPFEGLGAPESPEQPPAGAADENGEPFPEWSGDDRSEDDREGESGPTDDASAWQPLPEVSEASEAGESDEGGVFTREPDAPDERGGLGTEQGSDDPFGGPDPRGDPFAEQDAFERQTVGEIDPDEVWEDLAATDRVGGVEGRRYAEVSKHTYCENCEWFSDPPEVSCTREGTEIVEFLDMETVRLLNCPVVEERRAIRNED